MLLSRFFKPPVTSDIILRGRLLDIIDQKALKPLLILVAPGGFGKSIAVSQWLESRGKKFAWISMEKDFDDFEIFLSNLSASLKNSGFDIRTELLFLNTHQPGYNEILSAFVNDLDQFDDEFYIVLDDYHYIKNDQIHSFLQDVLSYSRANIHFIIISRTYPRLDFSIFQARLDVEEVSIQNLKFNSQDFSKLVHNSKVKGLTQHDFDKILDYTDGWIVGLILALNTINESPDSKNIIDRLKDKTSLSLNFFLDDLLGKQAVFIKKYLILTALLRRFSKGLLTFLISKNLITRDHSTKMDFVKHIRMNKLFIVELDEKGEWFRYHHIFQKFLVDQAVYDLSDKEIVGFFDLSSRWFSRHGFIEEAMEIALKKEDQYQLAISIFNQHKNDIINKEQFNRLVNILKFFPSKVFAENATLLSARAFLADINTDYTSMAIDLKNLDGLINSDKPTEEQNSNLRGEYYALLSCMNFLTGNVIEAQESGEKALLLLPSDFSYFLDFATAYTAMCYFVTDSLEKSILFLDDVLNGLSQNNVVRKTRLQSVKSMVYALDFKLNDLRSISFQYYQQSYDQSLMMTWVTGSYFLGLTYYQSNKLKEVSSYLKPLIESRYSGRPFWNLSASFIYLKTQFFLGNLDEFKIHLIELDQWVANRNDNILSQVLRAIKAEFSFFKEDFDEGKKYLLGTDFRSLTPAFSKYNPQTTCIKLNLSSSNKDEILSIGKEIDVLISKAETLKNRGLRVQALALKAIYFEKLGDFKHAVKCLEESIQLNNRNYSLRVYLDFLPILKPAIMLLKPGYNKSKLQNDLIEIVGNSNDSRIQVEKNISLENIEIEVKALSKRELELLDLLSKGYTNSQISKELFISPSTVKKHFYRIYKKLGVRNRVNAILRAKDLGMIKAN